MTAQQTLQTEEYKETELGELPKEWNVIKLGDYCNVDNGYAFKSEDYVESGILNFRVTNIKNNFRIDINSDIQFLPKSFEKEYSKYLLSEKDILFVMVGATRGKIAFIDKDILPALLNQNMWAIRPFKEEVGKKFLYYFLLYEIPNFMKKGSEEARGFFKKEEFRSIKIPLPNNSEQQKIVDVLSTIQEAQEKTANFINSLKELKKSTMKHLFTYGAVNFEDINKVELKETEIGEMPNNWKEEPIKKFIEKTEQKDMRKTNIEFKYIDVSSVDRENSRIISYSNFKGKDSPSRARKIVKLNDVIIATVRPTLKRIAKINQTYNGQVCSTAFCVLRADEANLYSEYLFYNIHRDSFITELGRLQKGANYPAVGDSEIKNQKIQIPSFSEQQQIASILSSIDLKIQAEEQKKEALKETFNSLLKNLMTAKIRVNNLEVCI